MIPIDDQLLRLFRAARGAEATAASAPYGLETRALAAWKSAQGRGFTHWDMTLLVRGLVAAIVIMGISSLPVWTQTTDPFSDYLQVADSTLPADVSP